jgi:hypothetical protein
MAANHHDYDLARNEPENVILRAVRAQWHRTPPTYVADWLAGR